MFLIEIVIAEPDCCLGYLAEKWQQQQGNNVRDCKTSFHYALIQGPHMECYHTVYFKT